MSHVYDHILAKCRKRQRQFVVLIDPEKATQSWLCSLMDQSEALGVDMYFVGGSTMQGSTDDVVKYVKSRTASDVVLFPGSINQISPDVDAVLFLSLISGRNAEFLIGSHVKAVPLLGDMEVISVGYMLIDGGRVSSTQRVTGTLPMDVGDVEEIINTAKASELLGHKMVYLEAGSGASIPVDTHLISAVKAELGIPLIVGGGIRSQQQLRAAYDAGADIVVVGNVLEHDFSLLQHQDEQ